MLPLEPIYIQHLSAWITDLKDALSEIQRQQKEAIVIAISRKMPKMFEWLSHQSNSLLAGDAESESESLKEFVANLNLTTEYALPFLFKDRQESSYEVIVVDDIIISGSTLRQVSSDIFALTGKKPIASTIFKCKHIGNFPYARTELIDKTKELTDEEADRANKFISNAILSSALPMDMVFPVFHVSERCAIEFADKIKKDNKLCKKAYPVVHEEENIHSESIILKNEIVSINFNDFAKCRFFYRNGGKASIVMYAPCIIPVDVVMEDIPFDNEVFKSIWKTVTKQITDIDYAEVQSRMNDAIYSYAAEKSIKNRRAISLTAVANYLFSFFLLCFLLRKFNIDLTLNSEGVIKKTDIRLILGARLTDDIFNFLLGIITSSQSISTVRERIEVEDFLCPENYKDNYDLHRNGTVQKSQSIEKALDGVFGLQRNPESFGLVIVSTMSPESAGVGESFDSLISLLAKFKNPGVDIEKEVNAYIDREIDKGSISSFYATTKSPGKTSYLKRYFRAGANSVI